MRIVRNFCDLCQQESRQALPKLNIQAGKIMLAIIEDCCDDCEKRITQHIQNEFVKICNDIKQQQNGKKTCNN